MKPTILAACLLPVLAVASLYGAAPAQAADYATVEEGQTCYLYDRYDALVPGENWSISQVNGSYSASCKVKGTFGTGENKKFANFDCYTSRGWATKVYEQIDSKGNATMTCQVKL